MSLTAWNQRLRACFAVGLIGALTAGTVLAQDDAAAAAAADDMAATQVHTQTAPTEELPLSEGFENFDDQASYAVGLMVGQLIQRELVGAGMGDNLDLDQITAGLKAALGEGDRKLDEQQVMQTMMAFQQKNQQEAAERNTAQAEEFLAKNRDVEGVVTLPSGMQYKITEQGTGQKPQPTDTVSIHYTGKLLDGTVFDSSVERGQPASFPLDRVIPGFSEGIAQLPVGSKATLYIPGNMAYGMNPQPGSPIGPNAMLIFDIELLGIEQPAVEVAE
jgi:FKBP-type peptidyl-prolyl cis-trans isomerase FkpA